jgi:hypothetical protein
VQLDGRKPDADFAAPALIAKAIRAPIGLLVGEHCQADHRAAVAVVEPPICGDKRQALTCAWAASVCTESGRDT